VKKKLYIITNESFYLKENSFFCDNIDLKVIPEELGKYFEICIIGRKSKKPRTKKIEIKDAKIFSNIIFYLFFLIKSLLRKNNDYLIISISPYTFFSSVILKIFFKKHFIYLRSDGYEEYEAIYGFFGKLIYHIMFNVAALKASLISCRKHILKSKIGKIVHPSQLNEKWFEPPKSLDFNKIKLLYVGRIKVEKGIYSLLKMIKDSDIKLTIVTAEKEYESVPDQTNVKIISFENYNDAIIKFYDEHNILILPSFTEGHPQVLDEALARKRPVIVFKEISHVLRDRTGIFAVNRDFHSLKNIIEHIKNNYPKIEEDMKNNKLPTKNDFIEELKQIIF
jgi:glycosyltransferase involved in cell wall biosynthesis|tara:strand:+ start:436 stop:1446 length:1011 start_codon:yes stop_codon:yes gene_type:complete